MKYFLVFYILIQSVCAQSIFGPENGKYIYDQNSITEVFDQHAPYIQLKKEAVNSDLTYKLDKNRNEYQIKNWYLNDWFELQDMYEFNQKEYIKTYSAVTFNEAKRNQYRALRFHKKKYYHFKEFPVMKEWGGLTHPPVKSLTMNLVDYDKNFAPQNDRDINEKYFDVKTQLELDELSKSELTFNNKLQVLADNDAFEAKKELILSAKKSILISSLVFVCDPSTQELVDLLVDKHRSGIEVIVIVDGFMSKFLGHRKCLKQMHKEGISVSETKDFFKHKLKAIYHSKVLVVDLKKAIAGGHNLIDADNTSRGTDFKNRDVDLYVEGALVTDIAKQFLENWNYQRKYNSKLLQLDTLEQQVKTNILHERLLNLRGKEHYADILSNKQTRMSGVCRFIKQAPYEDRHSIGKAYLKLLDQVSEHLIIADPLRTDTYTKNYFKKPIGEVLDSFKMYNQLHLKVQKLAKENIKIDYITTNATMAGNENVAIFNSRITQHLLSGNALAANWNLIKLEASNNYYVRAHYNNLMKDWMPYPNVHVWNHISFMHSKIFYFDRIVSSIGSYNFQHNATDHAYESTAICMDQKLNDELDKVLVQDMANSIPLVFSKLR